MNPDRTAADGKKVGSYGYGEDPRPGVEPLYRLGGNWIIITY
jgi:hypothetical protein